MLSIALGSVALPHSRRSQTTLDAPDLEGLSPLNAINIVNDGVKRAKAEQTVAEKQYQKMKSLGWR